MSEAKFTRGPWLSPKGSMTKFIDARIGSGMLQEVCSVGPTQECSQQEANDHLIAAAPEMYEMLETCLSEMHGLIDEVNDQRASRITSTTESEPDYHDQETLHLIQLLLAKARGEQND